MKSHASLESRRPNRTFARALKVVPLTTLAGLLSFVPSLGQAQTALKGDVDRNGKISTADAVILLQAAVGLAPLDTAEKLLADVNGDGKVNAADAILVLRRAVGLTGDLGTIDLPPATASITAAIVNNETIISWPKTGSTVGSLTFTQGSKQKVMSKNLEINGDREQIRLQKVFNQLVSPSVIGNDYSLLSGYDPNQNVKVDIVVAAAPGSPPIVVGSADFKPLVHSFDPEIYGPKEPEVSLDVPFSNTAKMGDPIAISGHALSKYMDGTDQIGLRSDAFLILPSGLTKRVPMTSTQPFDTTGIFGSRIAPGGDFKFNFPIESEGVYTVEINNYQGLASFSQPIYVGAGIPLLPGLLDVQGQIAQGTTLDLKALQTQWVTLLNASRAQFGLQPITEDDNLSKAAQDHAQDMEDFHYLGHVGLDGSTPEQRAFRAGEPASTHVTENLANGGTVEDLHNGLMASAIHRDAILNPIWTRVGLGISHYNQNLLLGVEELGVPVGEWSLPVDYFQTVLLDSPLPTKFVAGQPVLIRGTTLVPADKIIIAFQKPGSAEQPILFPQTGGVKPDENGRFTILVALTPDQVGEYQLGVFINNVSIAAYVVVTPQ